MVSLRGGMLEALSYGDLAQRVRAFAAGLRQLGIAAGDPVALIGPNGFEWVTAWLGIVTAGAVAVPIDDTAPTADIRAALTGASARYIVCSISAARALAALDPNLDIIAFGEGDLPAGALAFDTLLSHPTSASLAPPQEEATVMLAYTSGTTGAPKAIVLSRSNIDTNVRALVAARLIGPTDHVLLPLPLQHIYPLVVGLLVPLSSGATIVFPESVTGSHILEAIRLANVSAIVGVPRLYSAICSGLLAGIDGAPFPRRFLFRGLMRLSDWLRSKAGLNAGRLLLAPVRARFGRKLRLLVSGGARMEAETFSVLSALGFEIRTGYGLAETASMFTGNLPGSERRGSEGRPIAGSVRIAKPDPSGVGEIELKGPQVFSRYFSNQEATRTAFTEDGWLRTGDMGRIDNDGFLFVSGRDKDRLVLGGGNKVDPEELEKAYGTSRYIREIAVLTDKASLVALVVPSFEATREGGATHIDTAIHVDLASIAQTLPSYHRLAGYAISHEALPRTRLGKFRRFLLPPIYERLRAGAPSTRSAELTAEDEAILKDPTAHRLYDMLLKRAPQGRLGLDANLLLDLGIDSLEWISLGLEMEDRLGVRLTEADMANALTVRDLIAVSARASIAPSRASTGDRDWTLPTGPMLRVLGALLCGLNWLGMRALFRLRVQGRANLPTEGSFVLIANHSSYLDAPAIAAALGYRQLRRTYWGGDPALLFSKPWQIPFMRAMHCYPMDERAPSRTLAASEAILKRGDCIVWFPEGWRSPDGNLQPFLPGLGHLLMRVAVPVIPVHVAGTFEALPRSRSVPILHPIRIRIGRPIEAKTWLPFEADKKTAPQRIVELLFRSIERLGQMAGP